MKFSSIILIACVAHVAFAATSTQAPVAAPALPAETAMSAKRREDQEKKTALVGKASPELHFAWASKSDAKTLSHLKGKVVILDFWATWNKPSLAALPITRELVQHYPRTR